MRVNNKKSAVSKTNFIVLSFKVIVCTLLLSGTALADGTLSGTVVDAADGVTPVYPVYVALIDPVTGEDPSGLEAVTDSEGYYEITAIPAGDYKVHFNAVNTANGYVDELYNGIPCDNGGCGMDVLGDVISFANDAKTLNVDLELAFLLSGIVSNQAAQPIANLQVEVFDGAGNWICCNSTTNGDGEWSLNVTEPGDYYVRTANFDTQGYLPEIWDNILCDDCDPVATGTAVVVTGGNVGGIDFELSSVGGTSNTCGSGDLITTSSFEDPPDYTLEFLNQQGLLFTDAGQEKELSLRYLDEQGQEMDTSGLEWCLSDESLLNLNASGPRAMLNSTGFEITSVDLFVRDPQTNIRTQTLVVFAGLTDDAIVIEEGFVLSGQTPADGETGLIRLQRNPQTEALTIGMVMASQASGGILVRIVAINVYVDYIDLTVEPATALDFYDEIDIDTTGALTSFQMESQANGKTKLTTLSKNITTTQLIAAPLWDCDLEALNLATFSPLYSVLSEFSPRMKFTLGSFANENVFEFAVIGSVTSTMNSGLLDVKVGPKVTCQITAPAPIPTPVQIPIPFVGLFGISFAPLIGFEAGATSPELSTVIFQGSDTKVFAKFEAGVGWSSSKDFYLIGEADKGTELIKAPAPVSPTAFSFELTPFTGAEIYPTINFIGPFKMFTLAIGAPFKLRWTGPWDYRDPAYKGPSWTFGLKGDFKFDPGLGSWVKGALLKKIPLGQFVGVDLSIPIFSGEINLFGSPNLSLDVDCSPESCDLDPEKDDFLRFKVATEDVYWSIDSGKVDLMGVKQGAPLSTELVSNIYFSSGDASGTWNPSGLQEGKWDLKGMLWNIDPISLWRPYVVNGVDEVEVVPTFPLDVEIINTDSNGPIEGDPPPNLVSSDIAGIDCGEVCSEYFPVGMEITLTAHEIGNWEFVKWGAGGACAESDLRECTVTMDSDQRAKALYKKDIYSFAFGYAVNIGGEVNFVEMPELYTATNSITLLNRIGYTIALKKEGAVVGPFIECYPPLGGEYLEGCTSRFNVAIGPDDENVGAVAFTLRDEETGIKITREINVIISNKAYRSIVGKTFSRTVTGGTFCAHAEEEVVFGSDFQWTSTWALGGGSWGYLNDVALYRISTNKKILAMISTGNPYICETPKYLRVYGDGTADGGSVGGNDWKEYSY